MYEKSKGDRKEQFKVILKLLQSNEIDETKSVIENENENPDEIERSNLSDSDDDLNCSINGENYLEHYLSYKSPKNKSPKKFTKPPLAPEKTNIPRMSQNNITYIPDNLKQNNISYQDNNTISPIELPQITSNIIKENRLPAFVVYINYINRVHKNKNHLQNQLHRHQHILKIQNIKKYFKKEVKYQELL